MSAPRAQPARLHAVVEGLVQGVGFRQTTLQVARRLGLSGWVRNQPDWSVETVAEGPRVQLDAFLDYLREGPSLAQVTRVRADWLEPTGEFSSFHIR